MDDRYVATLPGVQSGMSVAIMDAEGDYGAVIVSGANLQIDPEGLNRDALWQDATHLVLQNEIPEALNVAAARAARARGLAVVLNAAPARDLSEALAQVIDILVVNAGEAEALSGISVASWTRHRPPHKPCQAVSRSRSSPLAVRGWPSRARILLCGTGA